VAVSDTALGNEVLALARDQVPLGLSVEFMEVPGGSRWTGDRRVTRTGPSSTASKRGSERKQPSDQTSTSTTASASAAPASSPSTGPCSAIGAPAGSASPPTPRPT
jgi:hypothetical protein